MPSGKHKARGRFRKVSVRTPGGKTVVHFRERNVSKAVCGTCKKPLAGVPRLRSGENLPKSQKRPERPYGGTLCSACTRQLIKEQARSGQ
ncbi:50S ribosomal protein L34e [Candidatus Woesearchaeota archaeon]|nr:50S ribosomal protein L34e [Candidatus Woesearchaeota archaeon]MBT5740490.1 50S ribosomal protein L34e [Candidatus Woesearchaeota archaeon]MBT7332115.1 50S ribosomal protein L34e [Candidatus Woesearchaeota archaeon]